MSSPQPEQQQKQQRTTVKVEGTPDSYMCFDFLPKDRADTILQDLEKEIEWRELHSFSHPGTAKGRVGVFQGKLLDNGSAPYLRCPSIAQQTILEMTPLVSRIQKDIADQFHHALNIVKIQKYETCRSNIPPHGDKIVDLRAGVPIYNLRFGKTRILRLTHKQDRNKIIDVQMPHNALLILGSQTNDEFMHGVPQEKSAADEEQQKEEKSISLIFRESVTYQYPGTDYLFGERTRFPTFASLRAAIEDGSIKSLERPQYEELKKLFQVENSEPVTVEHYREFCEKSF